MAIRVKSWCKGSLAAPAELVSLGEAIFLRSGAIMKITLDLSKLIEEGKLTAEEAARLRGLAAHDTGSLAINILVGFGVVAVSAGALALVPTPAAALVLGLAVFAVGLGLIIQRNEQWSLLAQVCVVLGALLCCGAVLILGNGALSAMLIVTAALTAAAIIARSGLLMAAAVLALGACLGARAGYWHATLRAGDLRAGGDGGAVQRAGAGNLLCLEAPGRRLRTPGAGRRAHLDLHGELRLLDRFAVGRPAAAASLAAVQRPRHTTRSRYHSAGRLFDGMGDRVARRRA